MSLKASSTIFNPPKNRHPKKPATNNTIASTGSYYHTLPLHIKQTGGVKINDNMTEFDVDLNSRISSDLK